MKHPGMGRIMNDLRSGKLEYIVIWRLDRLGRTAIEMLQLCEELRERKVDLVSIRDGLMSLNSAAGRMFFGMLANFAQFENEIRSERVRAGQSVAKAKGKRWGGSKPGWYARVAEK
jgi:DNA invertase Pin-like site-specific DNA recombinase